METAGTDAASVAVAAACIICAALAGVYLPSIAPADHSGWAATPAPWMLSMMPAAEGYSNFTQYHTGVVLDAP